MNKEHHYQLTVEWTGNTGKSTSDYRSFERSHIIKVNNKPDILGSSDPAFRGDRSKHNPEELLLASLSSCHMLWYLHLCAENGIVVTDYIDQATGTMFETLNGGGKFKEVTLNPIVIVDKPSMISGAIALHKRANEVCFIANSVNFLVLHKPQVRSALSI